MRVVGVVLAAALLLTGCTDDGPRGITLDNRPAAESDVDVDTPALREAKAAAGIEDCTPGPGGGALPALTLPCLGGGTPVDLSSLKGPMVLSFWGSWCPPCAKEMPVLQAFHEAYGDQVPLLGVDFTDRYPASAIEQMAERGVTYPSLADPGGDVQGFEEFAKIAGMPMLVLVDADGAIAYRKFREVADEAELVGLVEEHLGIDLAGDPGEAS